MNAHAVRFLRSNIAIDARRFVERSSHEPGAIHKWFETRHAPVCATDRALKFHINFRDQFQRERLDELKSL